MRVYGGSHAIAQDGIAKKLTSPLLSEDASACAERELNPHVYMRSLRKC